jgi:ribitol-5-phosphate 2-dehydrogenase (NADP+) / D-ribitol-5-phosphate cytidylyltransferase
MIANNNFLSILLPARFCIEYALTYHSMEPYFSAVILMGGEGKRMESSTPKQFRMLGNLKIYQYTLETFRTSGIFQEIILVCHPDWIEHVAEKDVKVVAGGKTRQESSFLGLKACTSSCQYVMIHDAVRPFVSHQILQKNKEAVLKHGAVDTVIPSADTLLVTNDGKTIALIPDRKQFRRGQTPQTFSYPLIYQAHENTTTRDATDDCQLVLEMGKPVFLIDGSEHNIKITTEWDFSLSKHLIDKS